MKHQRIYIEDYDWVVDVFYDTVAEDADIVLGYLRRLGCSGGDYIHSRNNLRSGDMDTGLTYSDNRKRESVMVIGRSSTLAEFLNSWMHESTHLQRHICQEYWINPYSEEAAYLAGDIAMKMHPVLSQFMCSCQSSSKTSDDNI